MLRVRVEDLADGGSWRGGRPVAMTFRALGVEVGVEQAVICSGDAAYGFGR